MKKNKSKNCNVFAILCMFILIVALIFGYMSFFFHMIDASIKRDEQRYTAAKPYNGRVYVDGKTYYITNGIIPETIILNNTPIMFEKR